MQIHVQTPASVPAGSYEAIFEGVEEKESRDGAPYWRWSFTARTPEGQKGVSGISSTNTGPKAKANRWLTGILGRAPAADEHVDTDALVGSRCLVVLEQSEGGFANVTDVSPPPRLSEATIQAYADAADRQQYAAEPPF